MGDGLTGEVNITVRKICNLANVINAVYVLAHLSDSQIPVGFNASTQINQRHWDHPVFDGRGIGVEGEYLQLYRIKHVNRD